MTGHEKSRINVEIKPKILEAAKDFDLECVETDNTIQLSKDGNMLELFYKQGSDRYQGLYSFNGSGKLPFYNFRACIMNKFCLTIQH